MKKFLAFAILMTIAGFADACSNAPETTANRPTTTNSANTTVANATTVNTTNTTAKETEEETPSSVKAAFTGTNSFTKQHKDLSKDQISNIEKETGAKVSDTDHHSYLAFSNDGGTRKQIGAATVVKASGKEFVIVYNNKEGSPVIKEVRGEGVSADFLKQFAGKGHDDKFQIGADLKANGVDEAMAKEIAQAVRVDAVIMQTLYGAAHSH